MRRLLAVSLFSLALYGCAPSDNEYCKAHVGTPEYTKCMSYYHEQEALFDTDEATCRVSADLTYPSAQYNGNYDQRFGSSNGANAPSDFDHEVERDRLRGRVVDACMMQRGWNSSSNWQKGRHPVSPAMVAPHY